MNIVAVTQKGPNKAENEDRIVVGNAVLASGSLISELREGVVAIADGVGGNPRGAAAAAFVAKALCELSCVSAESMEHINQQLLRTAQQDPRHYNMATTLTGIDLHAKAASVFHTGNTRAYLLQSGKYLKQLTADDTTLHYLLATGRLSPEEADAFNRKNEITSCFGGGKAALFRIKISALDTHFAPIVLTSDGVHDYLSIDHMEDIIQQHGLTIQCCEAMIAAARSNGSNDDASVVLGESSNN